MSGAMTEVAAQKQTFEERLGRVQPARAAPPEALAAGAEATPRRQRPTKKPLRGTANQRFMAVFVTLLLLGGAGAAVGMSDLREVILGAVTGGGAVSGNMTTEDTVAEAAAVAPAPRVVEVAPAPAPPAKKTLPGRIKLNGGTLKH